MKEGGGKWILKEGITEEKGVGFLLKELDLVFFFGENEEDRGGG